ncbi:MAG TPA: hypothetical protein VJX94_17545 [Stellaceae bacterium]|nr:hypothetical protein [Stellaceae bacterium]
MERILILGCAGAGKSVLARKMAAALSLPVIHLDRHYWRPGWIEPDESTWTAQIRNLVQQRTWIMDGNFSGTLPMRLTAADTVIYLDLPTWVCILRVLLRTATWFGRVRRDEFAPGCRERLNWAFLKDTWRYRRDYRPRVIAAMSNFSGRLLMLSGPKDVNTFLKHLRAV